MRRGLSVVVVAACAGAALPLFTAENHAQEAPPGITVFTANANASSASFVDGDDLTPAASDAALGGSPSAVAVSKDGGRVAFALRDGQAVKIVRADGTNVQTIAVPHSTLSDLVWSPDGTRIYVAAKSQGLVAVLDTTTLEEIDTWTTMVSTTPSGPNAIDVLPDGSALLVLVASDGLLRKLQTSDGMIIDTAFVDGGSTALKVSVDGTRVIVVSSVAPRIFDTAQLDAVGPGLSDIGNDKDVAVAGTRAYVLNRLEIQDQQDKRKRGEPRSATAPTNAGIDVYELSDGTFVSTLDIIATADLHAIAVTPDGAAAYVSSAGSEEAGTVTRYLLDGSSTSSVAVGTLPGDIALVSAPPGQDVVSYFLPRKVKLTVGGAGKDSLIASGFYDDAGATVDFNEAVTLTVGTLTRQFLLSPNKKGTTFTFKDATLKMVAVPKLKGSSRGRFRLAAAKTTLGGLIPEDGPVEFHFTASGLPDAQGRIQLTDGAYKLGGKRGALESPVFFAAKASATLAGDGADSLTFTGGFATGGTTPADLGVVSFGFGDFGPVEFPALTRKGDVYKGQLTVGQGKVKITIDFLRETVVVSAKKIELGPLTDATVDVVFDPGLGDGPSSNTIRLGGAGNARKY